MKQVVHGQLCVFSLKPWRVRLYSGFFFFSLCNFFKVSLDVEVLEYSETVKQFKLKINSSFPWFPNFFVFGFSVFTYHEIFFIAFSRTCVLGKIYVPLTLYVIFLILSAKNRVR